MSKNKEKCHECIFRGDGFTCVGCDYFTITGHVRGAVPAEECTHFRKGDRMTKGEYRLLQDVLREKPKRKRNPGAGAKLKYDWDLARKMYDTGCNDGEIARKLGCVSSTVRTWRIQNNLPAHATVGGSQKRFDWSLARELYDKGYDDEVISGAIGCARVTVEKWRIRRGLPSNAAEKRGRKTLDWDKAKELYDRGLSDREIAEKIGGSRKSVEKWRSRNGLPANKPAGKGKKRDAT